jgi:hypothetical protein
MTFHPTRPIFCRQCGVLVAHHGFDDLGATVERMHDGVQSVVDVGWFCSRDCKIDNPEYQHAMADARAASPYGKDDPA